MQRNCVHAPDCDCGRINNSMHSMLIFLPVLNLAFLFFMNIQVKEQAANTLLVMYQHIGERLRVDLAKKEIHPAKSAPIN